MKTNDVLEQLARDVEPVTPLPPPWLRAAIWLFGAVMFFGVITLMMTPSAELVANVAGPWFLLLQIAAIIASVTAAGAAFVSVVPGPSSRVLFLTMATLGLWLGILVPGTIQEWSSGAVSFVSQPEWPCVAMIVLGSLVPLLGMTRMLRRGAPLTPRTTLALAVLASAGLANVVACVSKPHSSRGGMLIWHGSTVLMLMAVAAGLGASILTWASGRRAG
jgi:hypothetical protein